jgi:pre-rRNA-processing protein RIX1
MLSNIHLEMAQSYPLKALIQRLTSTPVGELPSIAYFLASSISACLISPQNPGVDRAALLHKLKARISSLLQERTPEGRFTAVIIAKAVIEAGGREVLVDSEPWLRGLIGILNKSDPVATKRLAIITVSRAFTLTQDYPSIVREITTPLLPSFNTACLAAIRPKSAKLDHSTQKILSPLLLTVLQCWEGLIPQHPATFRPFITRFRPICLSLLSDINTPDTISRSAGALLVALHYSAPKNTAASEWSQLCGDTVHAAHATADLLFRSVHEDWAPAVSGLNHTTASSHLKGEQPSCGPDAIGLAGWNGVHDGALRLSRLLGLLEASFAVTTATEVLIPLSSVIDLCARLLALTIPGTNKDSGYTHKLNAEFGKDEREMMWSEISTIHLSCMRLLCMVVERFQYAILPVSKSLIDHLSWLFDAEHNLPEIRTSSYEMLSLILPVVGPTATESDVKKVSSMIRHACSDLSATLTRFESQPVNGKGPKTATTNVDSFAGPIKTSIDQKIWPERSASQNMAMNLICMLLKSVPAHLIPNTLRTEIDRTAVLTQDKQALLASVLNPAKAHQGRHATASLLPFFVHVASGLEAESLLRPRMAVVVEKQPNGTIDSTADYEGGEVVENDQPSGGSSLSGRLERALGAPGTASVDEVQAAENQDRAAVGTTEANKVHEDEKGPIAGKRDFAAMDKDGENVWPTSAPLAVSAPEVEAKKARIDNHTLTTAPWAQADKGLVKGQVFANGTLDANLATTDSVLKEHVPPNSNGLGRLDVESVPQLNIERELKTKTSANVMEDSDSDIPEINIEPDTDEDEEDDEDMYS